MSPTELVLGAVAAIFTSYDPQVAEQLLAPDYIQHNVALPTGAAPILGFIPALADSGISVTTHRVISEDNFVVLHNTYENAELFGGPSFVAFDVFRVENGRVAEHWDNLTPVVTANPSGRTQTDGATDITDLDQTADNKALVTGFVSDVLQGNAPEKITEYVSTETYLQHNSGIADGLNGLGAALSAMADQGVSMIYTNVELVVAEGNFVFVGSEGTLGDTPTAFFDLFRVEDGLIVEHWDVVSEIPAEMAHDNGKF